MSGRPWRANRNARSNAGREGRNLHATPKPDWIANFIWGIADDVLRDLYVRGKCRDVILPMTGAQHHPGGSPP